jgi:hypothetical protein
MQTIAPCGMVNATRNLVLKLGCIKAKRMAYSYVCHTDCTFCCTQRHLYHYPENGTPPHILDVASILHNKTALPG